jgi:septal ring factor EnvC (AmiA/AmiB activator)
MLLNEFLKAHRKIGEQQKQIDALTTQLKEQAAAIQKVSDQLETRTATSLAVKSQP